MGDYTAREYANMILPYGRANCNANEAARLYCGQSLSARRLSTHVILGVYARSGLSYGTVQRTIVSKELHAYHYTRVDAL
ncbi:Protein of unknown function [Cotesia congregata]|uniref:Uncharacterized protein n=1 Tax=Cotesia congregata TaxID=51543 RepID=A0A8J2HQI0_COTCN|nr:Protein of unknown function [Cotesia congregata]